MTYKLKELIKIFWYESFDSWKYKIIVFICVVGKEMMNNCQQWLHESRELRSDHRGQSNELITGWAGPDAHSFTVPKFYCPHWQVSTRWQIYEIIAKIWNIVVFFRRFGWPQRIRRRKLRVTTVNSKDTILIETCKALAIELGEAICLENYCCI